MSGWGFWELVGVVAACLVVAGCFWFAERATQTSGITDAVERAKFKDSYTKTIAQVIGGGFVVLTLAWTINKDSETMRQASTTSANQQFIEAAKLMTSSEIATRTAGNHAYAKLVEAQPEFTQPVRNTLMAVVLSKQPNAANIRTTVELNAALTTLGKLVLPSDDRLFFRDLCLAGGDFSSSVGFQNADFRGAKLYAANFTWAKLNGAQFNGALLADDRFYGDSLIAHLAAQEAAWWEWERFRYIANFESADLTDVRFETTSVAGASFKNANLKGARFNWSDISRADFEGATNLDQQSFVGACYGKAGSDRERSMPRGLSTTIARSLPVCAPAVPIDDARNQSGCPHSDALQGLASKEDVVRQR